MADLYKKATNELKRKFLSKPQFPICLDIKNQYYIEIPDT